MNIEVIKYLVEYELFLYHKFQENHIRFEHFDVLKLTAGFQIYEIKWAIEVFTDVFILHWTAYLMDS